MSTYSITWFFINISGVCNRYLLTHHPLLTLLFCSLSFSLSVISLTYPYYMCSITWIICLSIPHLHPQPFPELLFIWASRWLLKYFSYSISYTSISCSLELLRSCHSPFFASLVIRTLAYAWTTGARFSNSITDIGKCPFCKFGLKNSPTLFPAPNFFPP